MKSIREAKWHDFIFCVDIWRSGRRLGMDDSPTALDLPQRFAMGIKRIHYSVLSSSVKLCLWWSWGEKYRNTGITSSFSSEQRAVTMFQPHCC